MLPNAPTLQALRERMANDLQLRMQQAGLSVDATQPGNGYTELVNVLAGVAYSLWGAADHIAGQQLIDTMDAATAVKIGGEYGIYRTQATYANGQISMTSTASVSVPAGTVVQSAAGAQFVTDAELSFAGAQTQTVSVTAVEAGAAGNLAAGQALSLVSPIAAIGSNIFVSTAISGGSDIEPLERFKSRILQRKKAPPLGGARHDYRAWAKEAHPDVTRAWVFEHENGVGSVVVRIVTEDLADPIPGAAVIATVNDYIDEKRPAGLRSLSVEAPTAVPLNLTFTQLEPNIAVVQASIESELKDLILREGGPDSTLLLSHIRQAISRATGEQDFAITLNSDLSYTTSEYPVLGTTTFP